MNVEVNPHIQAVHDGARALLRAIRQRNLAIKRTAYLSETQSKMAITAALDQEAEAFNRLVCSCHDSGLVCLMAKPVGT